ncbi:2056_t:CDS:2 [Paraglomus occultum]|uniref:2056_t:CDS:1 n=1 Tax=Paraglomus occultum TaxID=144539 RepID=A0A9N9D230_9GLOM|nr:2056_t:CDS:2 [Paraglomus occultum]
MSTTISQLQLYVKSSFTNPKEIELGDDEDILQRGYGRRKVNTLAEEMVTEKKVVVENVDSNIEGEEDKKII